MPSPSIILASGSPSRKSLLTLMGLTFTCEPQDIDETPHQGEKPHPYVRRLASEKALSAYTKNQDSVIIAADTVVYKSHKILQKPSTPNEALEMLQMLSGTQHRVFTGLCVRYGSRECLRSFVTRVKFRRLLPHTILSYVASEHWRNVSGGYSITGPSLAFIKNINGSPSSVMGVPISDLSTILRSFQVSHEL